MNKQERIEALAKEMAKMEGQFDHEYFLIPASVAVEMFWPLVEAAERQLRNYPDSTGHWIGIALSNLKEPSHD